MSIGHIVPGGAADQDGSVMTGDEIVGVDGEEVLGSSHHHVVELMAKAATHGRVTLTLRRRHHHHHNPTGSRFYNYSIYYYFLLWRVLLKFCDIQIFTLMIRWE